MKNNNVVLDFTQINSPMQDVAIMPANLAKKLLISFARELTLVPSKTIISSHIHNLQHYCTSVADAIQCSTEFIQERTLILNVANENWSAYEAPVEDLASIADRQLSMDNG